MRNSLIIYTLLLFNMGNIVSCSPNLTRSSQFILISQQPITAGGSELQSYFSPFVDQSIYQCVGDTVICNAVFTARHSRRQHSLLCRALY